jgi:hypothetical protein
MKYFHEDLNIVQTPTIVPARPNYDDSKLSKEKRHNELGSDFGNGFSSSSKGTLENHQRMFNHGRFNTPERPAHKSGPPHQGPLPEAVEADLDDEDLDDGGVGDGTWVTEV